MASVISRIIGVITRQGFPCLFHLLTGLYCPGCGGTRAFRALLAGNLLLSIRYHPLVAYMAVVLTTELVSFGVSRAAKTHDIIWAMRNFWSTPEQPLLW